ncbi:acyl-CoA thioesterase [Ferruginibacter sp. SUN002]|uniref:acyl-CoA thioesterase n=1 Tax=Ferruginibacter sp. SUN002 TaxID=2937789 RepID=UPI003D36E6F6
MARIKIVSPEKIVTSITIPVRITDINYGNHVGNDSFVSIIHEARVLWLKQNNFSELDVAGSALIMSGLAIEFKSESFYGDILTIDIIGGEISKIGFELFYKITTQRNSSTILVANAQTDMVCFDYKNKKLMPVPDALKNILSKR